jgi:cell division protein FtsB
MSPRPTRKSSAPGPGRGRTTRRPAAKTPTTRQSTRSTSALAPEPGAAARSKLTGRAAILLLVLAVLAVSYASSAKAWLNQRSENNSLRAQIIEQEAADEALKQDKRRWSDEDFIKMQARLRFQWVLPGEVGYRVIDADGEVLASDGASLTTPPEPGAKQDPAWWDSAWGSMQEAGKTPEEVAAEVEAQQNEREPASQIGGKAAEQSPAQP